MGVAILFAMGVMPKGWPWRFSPQILAVNRSEPLTSNMWACLDRLPQDPCTFGAAVRPVYALWGDSYAVAVLPSLADLAAGHGKAIEAYVTLGCAALLGDDSSNQLFDSKCLSRNTATMQALESSKEIGTVILISRYTAWLNGPNEPYWLRRRPGTAGPRPAALDPQKRAALFERQLDLTVDRLIAAGKTVVLVYPVPEIGFSVPSAVARALAKGGDPAGLNLPLASFAARVKNLLPILDKAGNGSGRVVRIYPHKRLCNSVECLIYADGKVLYKDDDHLSRAGVTKILPDFEPIFASDRAAPTATLSASGSNLSGQQ
jgi:hypothetical protein